MASMFPALLAGPMLRRTEPSQIYIWVATSSDYKITADLYEISTNDETDLYTEIPTSTKTQSIQFGNHLFIQLIHIIPNLTRFPTNQLIGYNLRFEHDDDIFDLGDLDLLTKENPQSIVYDTLNYPTFFISDTDQNAKFLFGSCRKLHGEGEDTLVFADDSISTQSRDLSTRSNALFLMGDQIYADDVADSLFRPIHYLGKALMGCDEPLTSIDNRVNAKTLNKINGRKETMKDIAKFTSRNAQNHLIEFGEYAAMYLLSWSPVLWEVAQEMDLFNSFDDVIDKKYYHFNLSRSTEKLKKLEQSQAKNRYTEQVELITHCQPASYKIRRLLANIPSYMIFDDHDITDDLNINKEWKQSVQNSPLGKHVVANGLSAYFAFQGWGNDPQSFPKKFISQQKTYFYQLRNKQRDAHERWVNTLWNHQPWHFVAPTLPKAVFLDTRTMREYEDKPFTKDEKKSYPPQLVNEQQFNALSNQLDLSGWEQGDTLIVISPTPVIGFDFIEKAISLFLPVLNRLGHHVHTVFDIEAWRYNGKGLTNMLDQINRWNPKNCIILSGDVHYSYSVHSDFTFSNGKKMNIKQITSSPIKNMSFHNLGPLVKVIATLDHWLEKNQTIYRYCDKTYNIQEVDHDKFPKEKFLWHEQLKYDVMNRFSILETENALGSVFIKPEKIENTFLRKDIETEE